MVDEKGPDEVLLALVLLQQLGALRFGVLHKALYEVGTGLTDDWCDCGVFLLSPADPSLSTPWLNIEPSVYLQLSPSRLGLCTQLL